MTGKMHGLKQGDKLFARKFEIHGGINDEL